MSRQVRYRVAAIALCGLVFGAPMVANATVSAGPVPERARQVTFKGGGVIGLSCRSKPDTESVVVPANSTLRLVNRTGYAAQLQLDGTTKRTVQDDASTEVVFRRGTTAVRLKPNCPVRGDIKPVLVTASPSEPAASAEGPDPTPATTAADPTVMSEPAKTVSPARTGAGQPKHGSAGRPSRAPHGGAHRPSVVRVAPGGAGTMPQGGAVPQVRMRTKTKIKKTHKTKFRVPTGTPGSRAPRVGGLPPGDAKTIAPGVPRLDVVPLPRETVPVAPSAVLSSAPAAEVVPEPMARVQPIPDRRPVGLLALIAVVCVMGVGAAAIRATVSQRANRANIP
ncbi:MAG TPA: hypothetical protein VGB74_21125 [Actinoplanes sp.]|jgi:hypothetical protein